LKFVRSTVCKRCAEAPKEPLIELQSIVHWRLRLKSGEMMANRFRREHLFRSRDERSYAIVVPARRHELD